MKSKTSPLPNARIVSHDDWIAARVDLLKREKELTRQREKLAKELRALPWEAVAKDYAFTGPKGPVSMADLFDGCSQLVVYHFMFGDGWEVGCKSCSAIADHMQPAFTHLRARDVSLVSVSQAPYAELKPFRRRMGWTFPWVSSAGSEFNRDFNVSFTAEEIESGSVDYNYSKRPFPVEEAPGMSVFARRPNGKIYHTYSRYGRGLEDLIGFYTYLDFVPKGRDEAMFDMGMQWVKFHDDYKDAPSKALALAR